MGCLSCKHTETINEMNPDTFKKESRWRCVVGLEAQGLEFNAQVGMVHSTNTNFQIPGNLNENLRITTRIDE